MCAHSLHQKNPNLSSSNPEQQEAAVIIQSEYRRHRASREADALRDQQAAIHIQAAYRGYRDRKCLQLRVIRSDGSEQTSEEVPSSSVPTASSDPATPSGKEDPAQSDRTTETSTSADGPQTSSAPVSSATPLVQTDLEPSAGSAESHTQSTESPTVRPAETDEDEASQAIAATRIQAQYRGYCVRKEYRVTVVTEEEEVVVDPSSDEQTPSDVQQPKTGTEPADQSEPAAPDPEPIEAPAVVQDEAIPIVEELTGVEQIQADETGPSPSVEVNLTVLVEEFSPEQHQSDEGSEEPSANPQIPSSNTSPVAAEAEPSREEEESRATTETETDKAKEKSEEIESKPTE